jgi:hypothetical protein
MAVMLAPALGLPGFYRIAGRSAIGRVPFSLLAFTAFDSAGAAFFVVFDAILVALAIEQAD